MANLVNLTPHSVTIHAPNGAVVTLPPSEGIARVATEATQVGTVDGFPVYREEYGEVTGLPEPQEGTHYIVSALVRAASPDRGDLLSPGRLVRDDQGRVIGCEGFVRT
jgi:hypothetical protein